MAKAAPAPAAPDPVLLTAIRPADMSPTVEKWNPNPQFDRADTPEAVELPPSSEDETPAETPGAKEDKPAPEKPAEPAETEEPPPAAAAKPSRRDEIRAAIEKQKEKLGLETAVTAERKKREAAEGELERIKKLPLREQLRILGRDPQTVQDQALIGGDLWADDAAPAAGGAPAASLPPEVAERLKRLDAIEARLADQDKTTQQQAIANAVAGVRDTLKAADVPALKLTPGGYQRVLQTAHEAWSASGKKGSAWDYVADAAAIVEDEIRAENPELAETVDLARKARGAKPAEDAGETTEEEKPAPKPTRVAVGKKVGTAPSAKPKPLPRDRDAKDREIKKMMGWD